MIKGLGISPGVSLGRILILQKQPLVIPEHTVSDTDYEISLFESAHSLTVQDNAILYEKTLQNLSEEDAAIFLAHKEILEDEFSLINPIIECIRNNKWNAAKATDWQLNQIISMFENMEDEYMRARASDARDIRSRLLKHLLGIQEPDLSHLEENTIIVSHEITPSETTRMDLNKVAGFISETGGPTSHSAIMARNLEIPAISQIANAVRIFENDMQILMNGTDGTIQTDITDNDIANYRIIKQDEEKQKMLQQTYRGKPTITKDGHQLQLWANIGSPNDIDKVLASDAEGIGLFRSEFLYMDTTVLPGEEVQFKAYKYVLEKMSPKPVVIRTLDIGGDKDLPALNLAREENPFLGYRAIRICLDRPDLFRTQLRALLRASVFGNLQIMFPMISSIKEFRAAKELLNGVKKELKNENIPYSNSVTTGMMIEVPATAILADDFAKEADFFSIGTNDLTQYTLAADRGNPQVAHLYDVSHPAVLNLIRHTIEAAHRNGIPCGICGEAAANIALQPLLIQYGIDELSMTPSAILKSRMEISKIIFTTP